MAEIQKQSKEKLGYTDQILVQMVDSDGSILRQMIEYRTDGQLRVEEDLNTIGKLEQTRYFDHLADGRVLNQKVIKNNADGSKTIVNFRHAYDPVNNTETITEFTDGKEGIQRIITRDSFGRELSLSISTSPKSRDNTTLETFSYEDLDDGSLRVTSRNVDHNGQLIGSSVSVQHVNGISVETLGLTHFEDGTHRPMRTFSYYNDQNREIERQTFAPSGEVSVVTFLYTSLYSESQPIPAK